MDRKKPAEAPPHLSPPLEIEALLDRQLGLLTEVLTERLTLARQKGGAGDPGTELQSSSEVESALQLVHASADLARARARLRGEMQLRYHVVREEGKKAPRFAYYDPAGLEEPTPEEAAFRAGGGARFITRPDGQRVDLRAPLTEPTEAEKAEFLSHYPKTPDDPVPVNPNAPRYDPNNPDGGGLDPEMPIITQNELTSMDGWDRYTQRWNAAKEAKAARIAAARAAVVPMTTQDEGRGVVPPEL
jgi:hypothetical protein